MPIFLDANILFSAAKSDGAVRWLLTSLLKADHQCCVDDYVVIEARRNLVVKGPEAIAAFDALLARLEAGAARAPRTSAKELHWIAEKDRPVLEAAIQLKCDVLVTGDKTHFGPGYGKTFGGVTIHSPSSLAELLDL